MTQTAHVTAPEAVYQILREAFRRGLELRPKTLRSRAALLYERIYESLIPLQKTKELHRRRMVLHAANTCAPSTPEPAIRSRISHPIRDISSCTPTRPRVVYFARARWRVVYFARARWGVRMCTDSGLSPPTLERHHRMASDCHIPTSQRHRETP